MKKNVTDERIKLVDVAINVCNADRGNHFVARALTETLKQIGFVYACPVEIGHYERINWTFSDAYVPRIISLYSSTGKVRFYLTLLAKAKVASVKKSMVTTFKLEVVGVMDHSS